MLCLISALAGRTPTAVSCPPYRTYLEHLQPCPCDLLALRYGEWRGSCSGTVAHGQVLQEAVLRQGSVLFGHAGHAGQLQVEVEEVGGVVVAQRQVKKPLQCPAVRIARNASGSDGFPFQVVGS